MRLERRREAMTRYAVRQGRRPHNLVRTDTRAGGIEHWLVSDDFLELLEGERGLEILDRVVAAPLHRLLLCR